MLFVNLPEAPAGASCSAAAAGLKYRNEWLWLPAAAGQPADPTAAAAGGNGVAAPAEAAVAWGQDEVLPAAADDPAAQLAAQRRLALTWWPGRGQTLDNPVIQRLLAAGSAAAAAGNATAPVGLPSGTGAAAATAQAAVLLFCRAGGSPYVFAGRLVLAGVEELAPQAEPAAADGGSTCLLWQLVDAPSLLGGDAGEAFRRMLLGS